MIKEDDRTKNQGQQKLFYKAEEGEPAENTGELIPSQLSAKIEEMARNLALNDASEECSSSSNSMFNLPKTLRMKVSHETTLLMIFDLQENYFKVEAEHQPLPSS